MITRRTTGLLAIFVIVAVLTLPAYTFAQDKAFSGLYGGVELGRQNIIGGSLIDDVDVLTQDTRTVFAFQGGLRYQFDLGLVIGIEGSLGFLDGTLSLSEPANQLDITYENSKQTTLGLIGGFAFGAQKHWLLFGYVTEATREFDVTINQADVMFEQRDEQGFLRYGIGVEKQVFSHLNLRISAGTGRADFGDRQTNIDVKKKLEFTVGGVFQL